MTIKFRSDATGGAIVNENGVDVLKIDSNGRVTFDAYGGVFTTGDFKSTMRTTAPAGWVAGDGGTIGSATSGATRANADTFALFSLWWGAYSDAQLPILTSAGAASTRGASAQIDWDAGKRLTVFDVRDRVTRNSGTSFVNGTKYATTTQNHQHKIPMGFDNGPQFYMWGDGAAAPVFGSEVQVGALKATMTPTSFSSGNIRVAYTDGTLLNSGGESAPNTIAMLGCFKL